MRKRERLAKRLLALGLVLCLQAFTPSPALADRRSRIRPPRSLINPTTPPNQEAPT